MLQVQVDSVGGELDRGASGCVSGLLNPLTCSLMQLAPHSDPSYSNERATMTQAEKRIIHELREIKSCVALLSIATLRELAHKDPKGAKEVLAEVEKLEGEPDPWKTT